MKLIPNIKLNIYFFKGISIMDSMNIPNDDFTKYLEYIISEFGGIKSVHMIIFGNKEFMRKHIKINSINFKNFETMECECGIYSFIKLYNNEVFLCPIQDKEIKECYERFDYNN